MELLGLMRALCVVIAFLLAPCASDDHVNAQGFVRRYGDSTVQMISLQPLLTRKLEPIKQDAVMNVDIAANRKLLIQAPSGNKHTEEEVILHQQQQKQMTGTWREWIESPNKSDFFTMDYHWVRRRRPIHNKHFRFIP